jgi:membrane protease YdiL (CAAX protease family)
LVCDFQVVLPLLLILKLTKEPWARFGIVRFSWLPDLGAAVMIWLCALIAHDALRSLLPRSLFTAAPVRDAIHWATQDGPLRFLLLLASCLCTAFAEELVMRGYLLTRLERLLRSTGLAILVTAALFASYHVYQGTIGLAGAAAMGLVYGIAFCLQRRLWPVCIAHAMWNFIVMTHTG